MLYYIRIGFNNAGFTNQIFYLITGIIKAYKTDCKVVVVDNFLNDINKNKYTPISEIFNIKETNHFLKNNYEIIIVDKYNINFELISCYYGSCEIDYIDLTDFIKNKYVNTNNLFIDKNISFNEIKGDPCYGKIKKFIIKYKINDYFFEETYDENLKDNININFNGTSINKMGWIISFNNNMFDKILKNIIYNNTYILQSELIINKINKNNKINVIHLRLENDGIIYWSRVNKIIPNEYKNVIENKYINLIKKYLMKTDETIIVSSSLSNGVINFLNEHNYNYKFIDKYFDDREKNAIIDLLISKYCNNVFIGNFNIHKSNGSTFSYYMWRSINDNVTKIYIDLDKIYDNEVIVKK
jgi:hypothetical protein